MYSYLRDTVLPQFPDVVKNNVKAVVKKTSAGNESSSIRSDNMPIWLFSAAEVGLAGGAYVSPNEGTVYPYYNNGTRAKGNYWWLRSPRLSGDTSFCRVDSDGSLSYDRANCSYGVSFGFCI